MIIIIIMIMIIFIIYIYICICIINYIYHLCRLICTSFFARGFFCFAMAVDVAAAAVAANRVAAKSCLAIGIGKDLTEQASSSSTARLPPWKRPRLSSLHLRQIAWRIQQMPADKANRKKH